MAAKVPSHFHFVFGLRPQTEAFALPYYLALRSCLDVNRPERTTLYYHHEPWGPWWDRIKGELELVSVDLVPVVTNASVTAPEARFRYAHHADWIRLEKLHAHGGVYADIDTLFVNPIRKDLFEHPFTIGREEPIGDTQLSLCNALMLSEPGSVVVGRWLAAFSDAFDGSWTAHSCRLITTLAEAHPELVHIEPERSFAAHAHSKAGVRTLMTGLDRDTGGIMSLHLWNHLWWDWDQVWRTTLFGALLTEDWIRAVDTTYTVLARPFLPPGPTPSRARVAALRALHRAILAADALYDRTTPLRSQVVRAVHPILQPAVHALRRFRASARTR